MTVCFAMIPQFQKYKGSFPYKMDSKNRVTIYSGWRPVEGEALNLMPSFSQGVKILKVLTQEAFEYRLEKITKNATSPKEEARQREKLVRLVREVQMNEQGKLLIPKDLAEFAGIEPDSDVTISAGHSHFEIWNRAKFEETFGLDAVPEEEDYLEVY
jgi:MraZ protein